jgi:hypothetical protein
MKTLFLVLTGIAANATTIFVNSDALSTANSSGNATVNLAGTLHPDPIWGTPFAGSQWISFGSTGDPSDLGYFAPVNGTVVMYTTTFNIDGAVTLGTLSVMADDTTAIFLNGHTLWSFDPSKGNCNTITIGCIPGTAGLFATADLVPYLVTGVNTLTFQVVDIGGASMGLDFGGQLDVAPTPEPSSLALLGCGAIALWVLCRRSGVIW